MTGLAALVVACAAAAGAGHADRHRFRELAMGCEVRIEVVASDADTAARAARAGFDRIRQLDEALSDYLPTGAVSQLRLVPGAPAPAQPDLANALELSLRVSQATDGAFDASCGAISSCWRSARTTGMLPDDAALDAARAHSGFAHVRVISDPRRVAVDCDGLALDFGAIGKGLAASEAIKAISAAGVASALVAVAGDIACSGAPPRAPGWLVRVATGVTGDNGVAVILVDSCISTSGDEAQSITVDGVRHSHVFDPRTGRALTRGVAATVVAKDGAIADALSTALCVDPEGLISRRDAIAAALGEFETRVVVPSADPGAPPTITSSRGWPQVPAAAAPSPAPGASGSADR